LHSTRFPTRRSSDLLAAAVRPGGSLLIVGHHPSDMHTSVRRPHNPDMFFTAEEIAAALESEKWLVVTASAPERQVQDPNGQLVRSEEHTSNSSHVAI